jgi:hypothetical protein
MLLKFNIFIAVLLCVSCTKSNTILDNCLLQATKIMEDSDGYHNQIVEIQMIRTGSRKILPYIRKLNEKDSLKELLAQQFESETYNHFLNLEDTLLGFKRFENLKLHKELKIFLNDSSMEQLYAKNRLLYNQYLQLYHSKLKIFLIRQIDGSFCGFEKIHLKAIPVNEQLNTLGMVIEESSQNAHLSNAKLDDLPIPAASRSISSSPAFIPLHYTFKPTDKLDLEMYWAMPEGSFRIFGFKQE